MLPDPLSVHTLLSQLTEQDARRIRSIALPVWQDHAWQRSIMAREDKGIIRNTSHPTAPDALIL